MLKCNMMMAVVAAAMALPSFGQTELQMQRPNRVAVMWRPLSLKSTLNGVTSQPFVPHPDGLLEFNESLH